MFEIWMLLLPLGGFTAFLVGREYEKERERNHSIRQWHQEQASKRAIEEQSRAAAEAAAEAERAERRADIQGRSREEQMFDLQDAFFDAFGYVPYQGTQTVQGHIEQLEQSLRDGRPHSRVLMRLPAMSREAATAAPLPQADAERAADIAFEQAYLQEIGAEFAALSPEARELRTRQVDLTSRYYKAFGLHPTQMPGQSVQDLCFMLAQSLESGQPNAELALQAAQRKAEIDAIARRLRVEREARARASTNGT